MKHCEGTFRMTLVFLKILTMLEQCSSLSITYYAPNPDDTLAALIASQDLPQKINFSRYMKQQPGAAEKKHKLKEH
jgi:hypothetical protein